MGYCDSDKGKVDFWRGLHLHHKRVWCLKPHLLKREMKISPFTPLFFIRGKGKERMVRGKFEGGKKMLLLLLYFLKSVDRWAKKAFNESSHLFVKLFKFTFRLFRSFFFRNFFIFSDCKSFALKNKIKKEHTMLSIVWNVIKKAFVFELIYPIL